MEEEGQVCNCENCEAHTTEGAACTCNNANCSCEKCAATKPMASGDGDDATTTM